MSNIQNFYLTKVKFCLTKRTNTIFNILIILDNASFLLKCKELLSPKDYLAYYETPLNVVFQSGLFNRRFILLFFISFNLYFGHLSNRSRVACSLQAISVSIEHSRFQFDYRLSIFMFLSVNNKIFANKLVSRFNLLKG
jgi:hypothetical protein